MSDIVNIRPPPNNDEVVNLLEGLLAHAKEGHLISMVFVAMYQKNCTSNGWAGINTTDMSIVGEIEALKVDLVETFLDMRSGYVE